jgi:hypothetical protein
MRQNTPPNWQPPFEAYEAKYTAEDEILVTAYIGVQDRGGDARPAILAARALTTLPDGPDIVEQGWSDDVAGTRSTILLCYWRSADTFVRWRKSSRVEAWLTSMTDPLVGRWMETAQIRPRALDTLIAVPDVNWGLAKLADSVEVTPYHAYWGGTRDRILMSAESKLENPEGTQLPEPPKPPEGLGQIIDVQLPENVVFSRGGPDWSQCTGEERMLFRNTVYPAYVEGGRYLRDNGADSGCFCAYFIQETDEEGRDVERNHQIGYFVQLSDLERWTKDHPTHKAIYGRFMRMMGKLTHPPAMNLYHEVSPLPAGGLQATYVNCLSETHLLPFGTVREG